MQRAECIIDSPSRVQSHLFFDFFVSKLVCLGRQSHNWLGLHGLYRSILIEKSFLRL
jgi:hypothetical protein